MTLLIFIIGIAEYWFTRASGVMTAVPVELTNYPAISSPELA